MMDDRTVTVMSRERACSLTPRSEICFISIWSFARPMVKGAYDNDPLFEGWKDSLRVDFDDATRPIAAYPHLLLFNEDLAATIVDFIEMHEGSPFIVHCDAGYSRSAAVGSFMEMAYGYTPYYIETGDFGDAYRNVLVVALLKREMYKRTGHGLAD